MEETIRWAVDALDSPMDRSLIADRLKEALQAASSRGPDAREALADRLAAWRYSRSLEGGLVKDLLDAAAALRSVPDGAAGEPVAWRYQRKEWDSLIWRWVSKQPEFETPSDWNVQPLYALPPATQPSDEKPIAMLGGIHGVCLIRHIENMQPDARKEYHTPLYRHPPSDERSDRHCPAATDDEDHPDCHTKRERELYFALMGLTSAVMTRRREWENWEQGGVTIAPIVRKALRLDALTDKRQPSMQEDGK